MTLDGCTEPICVGVVHNVQIKIEITHQDDWTCKRRGPLQDVVEKGVANRLGAGPVENDGKRSASRGMQVDSEYLETGSVHW